MKRLRSTGFLFLVTISLAYEGFRNIDDHFLFGVGCVCIGASAVEIIQAVMLTFRNWKQPNTDAVD